MSPVESAPRPGAPSGLRKWIPRLFLAGFSILLPVLAAEFYLGVSTPEMISTIQKSENPALGYEHIPNFTAEAEGWVFRYNSLGLRGPELSSKTPGRKRILFLGDSITDGRPLEKNSYPNIVEELLRAEGYDVECVNGGVTGYNVSQIAESLKVFLPKVQPDIVVYGLCLNDILPAGSVDETGGLKEKSSGWNFNPRALLRKSRILVRVGRAIQWWFVSRGKRPPIGDYAPYGVRVEGMYLVDDDFDRFRTSLDEMNRVSREANIPFVVAMFPLSTQFLGDPMTPQELIAAALVRRDADADSSPAPVVALDLKPALGTVGGALAYVPNDPVHPHDEAHRAVARACADELKKLIPRP